MTCPDCRNTGYVTITVSVPFDGGVLPDYFEVPCTCNPDPTDAEFDDCGYPGETPYPADLVLPIIDYDPALPAGLLA